MQGSASAYVVIGAGYGDEGKGLTTDALVGVLNPADVTVVRFNGGAQAGHTIMTQGGDRVVCHHLPAGMWRGAAGHLSADFVSNPMLFCHSGEWPTFVATRDQTGKPSLSADPSGYLTTPYDVLLNQIVETRRGGERHGSCGVGFGETVGRCESPEYATSIEWASLGNKARRQLLLKIRDEWFWQRLAEHGIREESLSEQEIGIARNDLLIDAFMSDCDFMMDLIELRSDDSLSGDLIFEGAQGLGLDMDYGLFPHVTRSNTGVINPGRILSELPHIQNVHVVYVSRCYKTRHGAGPLTHEDKPVPGLDIDDPTNVPNEWQGGLRSAPLSLDELGAAITADRDSLGLRKHAQVEFHLMLTCADQLPESFTVFDKGAQRSMTADEVLSHFDKALDIAPLGISSGPSASDIEWKRQPWR